MSSPRREVCFIIGREGAVLWSDASSNALSLPDSRTRWEAIWSHRHEIEEIAHSHPLGPLGFSQVDETTMEAIRQALGRAIRFSVVAPDGTVLREGSRDQRVGDEPWWAALLRLASGMLAEA